MSASEAFSGATLPFANPLIESVSNSVRLAEGEPAASNFSVSVAMTMQAVEKLCWIWKGWAHNPETDFDYYLHRLKNDSTILSPCVLTAYQDGVPKAILIGQVRKRKLFATVSFVKIHGPEAKVLEIENGGLIGEESDAIDRVLAMHILQAAKSTAVDLLMFSRLPLQSELCRELQKPRGLLVKGRVPHVFRYSVLPLNSRTGEPPQVFSGKHLRETRRKRRILQRAFPGEVRFKCFSCPSELDLGMREAKAVSLTTWQYYLGQISLDESRTETNLRFCADKGWLRVYLMYINDSPCAFLIGQLYGETFYCHHAGYDPNFAVFSAGSLLTAWAFEDLAASGVREVDLGEGCQEHNRRLGCRVQEEGTVHVYLPTLRGIRLNIFFALTQTVRTAGRKTITELRLNRLRKAWAEFLISRWRARNRTGDLCS
jgi:Acetyltransferase (GNAT) domain